MVLIYLQAFYFSTFEDIIKKMLRISVLIISEFLRLKKLRIVKSDTLAILMSRVIKE